MRYEIDIFHYLDIYKKEWKKMAFLIAIAMCITAVVAHLEPVTYRSTVIALSSKEGGQSLNFGGFGFGSVAVSNSSNDTIFSMLKSRRMSDNINSRFNPDNKPGFWWELDTYIVTGGFAIEVKGSDPQLVENIANFAVENVDKINLELQISPNKPMIKVLDRAIYGVPVKKETVKKVIASGLFVFLIYALFVFFREYFSQLKK